MAIADTIQSMYENVGEVYDTITNVDVNTGKNLFNGETELGSYDNNGNKAVNNNCRRTIDFIDVLPNTTYTLSRSGSIFNCKYLYYDKNKNYISSQVLNSSFTTPDNCYYLNFFSDQLPSNYANLMINEGSTALPYEPYTDTPTYKNIENIPKVIRNSYLEIMNNGIDKIWNNWEKVTGEGETLTLNSTEEAPMKINLKGNTSQATTTGKNLLSLTNLTPSTKSGITLTKNNDGTITLNGTASADANFGFAIDSIVASSSYKVQLYKKGGSYTNNYVSIYMATDSSFSNFDLLSLTNTDTISMSLGNKTYTYAQVKVNGGVVCNNLKIGVQVVNRTTNTFEPYTNGASPNPEYPQDIHVVSGDNSIDVCGKNLLNISTITLNKTIDLANGNVNVDASDRNTSDFILVTSSVTYSCNVTMTRIAYYDENKTFISSSGAITSIVTPNNCKYVRFSYNNSLSNIQFERGYSSSFTPYATSYPINLGDIELCKIGDYQDSIKKSTGKNLFDKNNANVLNGMFINASAGNIGSNANATSIYIPINPNTTYCVSKTKGNRFAIGYSSTTPAVNVSLTNIVDDRTKTSLTSTSSSDSKYLVIYISLSDTETYENIISTIQIEYGNTPTDFEPYGKVWYLNKQIGKVILNGSETINKGGTNTTNTQMFLVSVNGIITNVGNGILSDKFKTNINIWTYDEEGIRGNSIYTVNTCWIRINKNRLTDNTVQSFKVWLSSNNIIVYYVLETPTYTEITDSTLLSQLEAVKRSYDEQTNINQENNDLPFILDATALKQLTQ